jgi:hypothetical protein
MATGNSITVFGAEETKAELRKLGADAPAAVRIATTLIGEHAQRTMRATIGQRFQFRGTADRFEKAIVFQAPRASATRKITAVLKVGSDQGGTKATATRNLGVILARHEDASQRSTRQLYRMGNGKIISAGYFLPAKGLRTSSQNPPRSMYPTSIGAQIRSDPSGQTYFASGTKKGSKKKGTGASYFATKQGIFKRRHTGFGGRVEVEAIWWFRSNIRTPARLRLWETASEVFDRFAVAYAMDAIETVIERTSPRRLGR